MRPDYVWRIKQRDGECAAMTSPDQSAQKKFKFPIELTKHPIVLLFLGAIVSNFVVPLLTEQWQVKERQIAIKSDIIKQMSASVAEIVSTTELIEAGALSAAPEASADAFLAWSKNDGILSSRLTTYYPGAAASQDWQQFAGTVTNLYELAIATTPKDRTLKLRDLKADLPNAKIDWSILSRIVWKDPQHPQHPQYLEAWRMLKTLLYERRDQFTQEILRKKAQPL